RFQDAPFLVTIQSRPLLRLLLLLRALPRPRPGPGRTRNRRRGLASYKLGDTVTQHPEQWRTANVKTGNASSRALERAWIQQRQTQQQVECSNIRDHGLLLSATTVARN